MTVNLNRTEQDVLGQMLNAHGQQTNLRYKTKVKDDKIVIDCPYCNEQHKIMRHSYRVNVRRNGRYICHRENSMDSMFISYTGDIYPNGSEESVGQIPASDAGASLNRRLRYIGGFCHRIEL